MEIKKAHEFLEGQKLRELGISSAELRPGRPFRLLCGPVVSAPLNEVN